jgi:hypothetical protein
MCFLDDYLGCNPSFGPDDFKRILGISQETCERIRVQCAVLIIFSGIALS